MNSLPTTPTLAPALKPSWNPWPYGLVAFLGSFACAVIGFGIFAIRQNQDLVRPDYYDQEIRFQEQIDRVARTKALGEPVTVMLSADGRFLEVCLSSSAQGTIQLYRPADARLDREFALEPDAAGAQRLDVSALQSGLWKARVHWRTGTEEFFQDATIVLPKR